MKSSMEEKIAQIESHLKWMALGTDKYPGTTEKIAMEIKDSRNKLDRIANALEKINETLAMLVEKKINS